MPTKIRTRLAPQPSEYGSVCLAMLLNRYGTHVTLLEAARLCAVTKDGCTMEQIAEGAAALGFRADIVNADVGSLQKENTPCIVIADGKYVLLSGFKASKVIMYTPDRGRVTVEVPAFEESYGGRALFLTPEKKASAGRAQPSPLAFAFSLITKKNLRQTLLYALLLVGTSVLLLWITEFAGRITDLVFSGKVTLGTDASDLPMFWKLVLVLILLLILEVWIPQVFARFSASVSTRCRRSFMWSALNLPIDLYQIRSDGYFMESASHTLGLGFFLSKRMVEVIIRPLFAVYYLFFMARSSVPCCLVALCSVAVMAAATLISAEYENKTGRLVFSVQSRESGFLLEGLKAIRSIRNSGSEYVFFREFVRLNRESAKARKPYERAQKVFQGLPASISNITRLALILVGAWGVYQGTLSFGELIFVHGLYCVVADYIRSAVLSGQMILSTKYRLDNLGELCTEAAENEKTASTETKCEDGPGSQTPAPREEYAKLRGHIHLEHVSFGYTRQAGAVLNDISMDIPAGSSVAIVGASGCGKTTLKKLICGRHEPWSGEILYDGVTGRQVPPAVLSNSIASVDQQIVLFGDTVMNNIKMWDSTQLDADAILAAKDAEIHEEVILREGGYHSQLSEDGDNYSGGQRQRMEIARALSMDPSILVMDEATSALDTIVEKRIVDHVRERGITTIVVAHRLSTIRNCDCIYVMDCGRFVNQGTHDQLMDTCELYRRLVTVE